MKVLITDSITDLSFTKKTVIRWHGYSDDKLEISIPRYVDNNDKSLKQKYIDWNRLWFKRSMQNKFYNKYCRIGKDFEYLLASRIFEKSIWKSPLFDAIKLIALEEILLEITPTKVEYIGNSAQLHQAYKFLCKNLNIKYESSFFKSFRRLAPYNKKYSWIPNTIKALIYLILKLWSFRLYQKNIQLKKLPNDNAILFFMPLSHFNCKVLNENEYRSDFLTELPQLIEATKLNVNWLHYFVKSIEYPHDESAISCIDLVNKNKENNDIHWLIGEFMTLSIMAKVLINWIKISLLSYLIKNPIEAFQPIDSKLSLWPILKNDWFRSMRGPDLIENLLFFELVNKALDIDPQKYGFILHENQGLERIFSYQWHKHGHGKLVGLVHSTVRFWDFRFTGESINKSLIEPDLIAVNGKIAMNQLILSGYNRNKLVKVEALRYSYLNSIKNQNQNDINKINTNRILVLGDYNDSDTNDLMSLIYKTFIQFKLDICIHFKPHPNYSINIQDYPNLKIVFEDKSLEDILPNFNVTIATNKTTASVEAYISGLKTIVMLDKNHLNFSPLRGVRGVTFISNKNELYETLFQKNYLINRNNFDSLDYFYLDSNFELWKKLLHDL